jgi:hypothetical protein
VVPDEEDQHHLETLVTALCAAEAGRPLQPVDLPNSTAFWFLEHAMHFRAVAFAALRLMDCLVRSGDDAVRERVAHALAPFVNLYPAKVEQQLYTLAAIPAERVQVAVADTLVHLLHESDEPGRIADRWNERSDATRALLRTALERLAASEPEHAAF